MEKPDPAKTVEEKECLALNRDLESLGEFIERLLFRRTNVGGDPAIWP